MLPTGFVHKLEIFKRCFYTDLFLLLWLGHSVCVLFSLRVVHQLFLMKWLMRWINSFNTCNWTHHMNTIQMKHDTLVCMTSRAVWQTPYNKADETVTIINLYLAREQGYTFIPYEHAATLTNLSQIKKNEYLHPCSCGSYVLLANI